MKTILDAIEVLVRRNFHPKGLLTLTYVGPLLIQYE